MKILKFRCKALTDLILNVKSASEGNNSTLDFIPGSNFLGIVAARCYADQAEDGDEAKRNATAWAILHSGKVRFGDAHPVAKESKVRSLRVPASFYYPKGKKMSEECYVHHGHEPNTDESEQLKQCRTGFYVFDNNSATQVETDKSFAIKSAYDRERRRSKDEQMYGYESIRQGVEFLFEVAVDDMLDERYSNIIRDALIGTRRIGRSRTAQYGLVEIEACDYSEVAGAPRNGNEYFTVYADGRLIFLDEEGLPTFQPTIAQLGLSGGTIRWDKSQIRTFQYAPYNYKRRSFDTDRCGIEKGSVIVIEGAVADADLPRYVGSYQNEGYGRVVYNPAFLLYGEKGKTCCTFPEKDHKNDGKNKPVAIPNAGSIPLLAYLERQRERDEQLNEIYAAVDNFMENSKTFFLNRKFASQWGTIRSYALGEKDSKRLYDKIDTYISHGVKAKDWEGKRGEALRKYMEGSKEEPKFRNRRVPQEEPKFKKGQHLQLSLINLASEMAKYCRKEENNERQ